MHSPASIGSSVLSRGSHTFLHESVMFANSVGGEVVSNMLDHELVCVCVCGAAASVAAGNPCTVWKEEGQGVATGSCSVGEQQPQQTRQPSGRSQEEKISQSFHGVIEKGSVCTWGLFSPGTAECALPSSHCAIVAILRNRFN